MSDDDGSDARIGPSGSIEKIFLVMSDTRFPLNPIRLPALNRIFASLSYQSLRLGESGEDHNKSRSGDWVLLWRFRIIAHGLLREFLKQICANGCQAAKRVTTDDWRYLTNLASQFVETASFTGSLPVRNIDGVGKTEFS